MRRQWKHVICDNFEEPTPSRWETVEGVVRVTSPTRSGAGAIKASITAPTEHAMLMTVSPGFAAEPRLALRFWAYVEGGPTLAQANLIAIHDIAGEEITVLGYTEQLRVWRQTPSMQGYTGPSLPRDRWISDGSGYDDFRIGMPYNNFPRQGALTVRYDDIHLGRQPVGCQ